MRCFSRLIVVLTSVVGVALVANAHANNVALNPIDADSIKPYQDANYNSKGYIYSYYRDVPTNKHVGYMKYDLSSIPDGSKINSMTLRMYTEINFVTPGAVANIYRSSDDSWSSSTNDPYPGTNELLGADQQIFLSFSPYTWNLDVGAFNYQTDLTDNLLTLGITSPGYINWFAIDGLNFAQYPLLTIDYQLGVPIPGDANHDGYVDGGDYTIWADHYLQTGQVWETGDFTGEGLVDGADYTLWADNYAPAALATAVPEPATLLLAGIGAAIGGVLLRRRRSWFAVRP